MSEKRILRVGLIQQANTADHSDNKRRLKEAIRSYCKSFTTAFTSARRRTSTSSTKRSPSLGQARRSSVRWLPSWGSS